jgi:membrane protein YdbS with pleckstrin-like domain
MKCQSKLMSLLESLLNEALAFLISISIQITLFPLLGWNVNIKQASSIALLFAVVGVIRLMCVRRFFNYLTEKPPRR